MFIEINYQVTICIALSFIELVILQLKIIDN